MSEYSRRIIPLVIVTILVTTFVAVEVNNLYSPDASTSQTSTISTSQTSEMVTSSQTNQTVAATSSFGLLNGTALGSDGLQLSASLNASQLTPGQVLQVKVSVFNTFSTINTVPIADSWPFQGVPLAIFPDCDTMLLGSLSIGYNVSDAAEAVVVEGNYTISTLTSVAHIHFTRPGCAEGLPVKQVTFEPNSAQANLTGTSGYGANQTNVTMGPYHIGSTFTTNGYWDLQNISRQGAFLTYEQPNLDGPVAISFTPGVYTVGIEDMWGQAVILHFVVK